MDPTVRDIVVAILVGVTIWLIKAFLQNYFTTKIDLTYGTLLKVQQELDDHMEDCDKVPKEQIIEKIDNLCEKVDDLKESLVDIRMDMAKQIDRVEKQVDRVDKSYHDFKQVVTVHLLGRRDTA